jgi:ketosteroid isomerase-like protein
VKALFAITFILIFTMTARAQSSVDVVEKNRETVDRFFTALETQQYSILREIFAPEGRQINPYVPEGFPRSFDGVDAIFMQYSGLSKTFGKMSFIREIHVTEDPNFLFATWRGEIEIKAGGTYVNNYVGIFRLREGHIIEYTEYFNPIVMARAFNITLK